LDNPAVIAAASATALSINDLEDVLSLILWAKPSRYAAGMSTAPPISREIALPAEPASSPGRLSFSMNCTKTDDVDDPGTISFDIESLSARLMQS
jgi:hypothetical protein